MRIGGQAVLRMLVLAAVFAGGAHTPAAAEDLKWLGVHGAYYSQYENVALGINARQDLGNGVSAGFLVDYIFQGQSRETWAAGADLQWETHLPGRFLDGWVGGGMGIFRDDLRLRICRRRSRQASRDAVRGDALRQPRGLPRRPVRRLEVLAVDGPSAGAGLYA
jgi:hypothetical protein